MARQKKLIQFYLTNMCNSRCNTCQIWQNKSMHEIALDKVIDIMHDFPDADYVFGGGEFTLYTNKEQLLATVNKLGVNYTILSNAVNIKLLEPLLSFYNVQNLTMSCDGIHHDNIRGIKGNLDNIMHIVTEWKNKIPNIKLSYTLSKLNEECIDDDMHFFKSIGFNKIYFCIAQNMDLLKAEGNITPNISNIKYLLDTYNDMLYDKDVQLLKDICNGKHRCCDSTNDVHTIYTNGDVVRCQSFLSNVVLGNINNNSLKSILESSERMSECPYNDKCELVCQRRYDYA